MRVGTTFTLANWLRMVKFMDSSIVNFDFLKCVKAIITRFVKIGTPERK